MGAGEAENIVEAELKLGSAGMETAAVSAERGLGIVDVGPRTAELVRGSRARAVKMGQKVSGTEVADQEIEQVDFVVVGVVEEHLEQAQQEAWSVVKEELHVDAIVGWEPVAAAEHPTVPCLNSPVVGSLP